MQTKTTKYVFKGINQDVNDSRHPNDLLFSAENIRFLTTEDRITGGIAFEKGNALVSGLPTITIDRGANTISYDSKVINYSNGNEIDTDTSIPTSSSGQKIIGHTVTRNSVILFSTDDLGMDCIWELTNDTYELELVYLRNLAFSINNPIQAIFNFENENIQKVYWVDGVNQIRSINLEFESIEGNGKLIDLPATSINFVGEVTFTQPVVNVINRGGSHTAGMIQYVYNLFNLNSSQTKLSPASEIIPLDNGQGQGGGALNERVGASPVVEISNIDPDYNYIRVYAIKYTSLDQVPSIGLIEERELAGDSDISITDDGSVISTLSLEELLFVGSDPVIPKQIEAKDNSLFLFNVSDKSFDVPDELDCRAYSFPGLSTTTIVADRIIINSSGVRENEGTVIVSPDNNYNVPNNIGAINPNYVDYIYKYNSLTLGGSGNFFEFRINLTPTLDQPVENYRFFKDREIYRLGVEFYNRLGQVSPPKWMADYRVPCSNLEGQYGTLEVTTTPAFTTFIDTYPWPSEDEKPVGYRIVRANRGVSDKTILCQGLLNGMMVNSPRNSENAALYTFDQKKTDSDVQVKLPNFLVRTFEEIQPLKANSHLEAMQFNGPGVTGTQNKLNEIQYDPSERKADTYQYNVMNQLYSPEIMFDEDININSTLKLTIIGGATNTDNSMWGQERRIETTNTVVEGKTFDGLTPHASGTTNTSSTSTVFNLMDRGLISDTNGSNADENVEFIQWYRQFNAFDPADNILNWPIYGTPEVTERGQGRSIYNNDSRFEYSNSLEGFLSDGEDNFDDDGAFERTIISLNSFGAKCVTLVAGDVENNFPSYFAKNLSDYKSLAGGLADDVALLGELTIPENDWYVSNIYGGNSAEDKKRTSYIKIGEYQPITSDTVQINSPGDTYVQAYKFLRIAKTDTEVYSTGVNQITEVVEVTVETTVDLKNRNDQSFTPWDNDFQPRYDEYHEYNTVYSQQPTLIQNTDADITFRQIKNFDTRIQASKTKIPNESIDSWTDLLVNETLDLDGKYGPINGVTSFRDQIYTFQDNAIALIGINPRVQTQGTDGISIELGTGNKLFDYQYVTTKSGTLNRWGIVSTESGFYYLDGLNKRYYRYTGTLEPLSELKGLHSYLESNLDVNALRTDNPLLGQGISMGYDQANNDVYLTYNNTWTLGFSELLNEFTGFYSYNTPMYIFNKEELLTLNPSNNSTLYETHAGAYNRFYGVNQPSKIIMIANPEPDHECLFNNLEYKADARNTDGIEQVYTWETIRAYNEFQDSGIVPLTQIRKLNRKFRLAIPRNANSRDRIRNNWTFIELSSNNNDNFFYLNHDIILYYMPNYIIIQ